MPSIEWKCCDRKKPTCRVVATVVTSTSFSHRVDSHPLIVTTEPSVRTSFLKKFQKLFSHVGRSAILPADGGRVRDQSCRRQKQDQRANNRRVQSRGDRKGRSLAWVASPMVAVFPPRYRATPTLRDDRGRRWGWSIMFDAWNANRLICRHHRHILIGLGPPAYRQCDED